MKRSILLAVPALLLVAACGGLADMLNDTPLTPIDVSTATFAGVWTGYESSARYELRTDGTFTATGVPASQLDDAVYERHHRVGPFHGHGHWKLDAMTRSTPHPTPQTSRRAIIDFDEVLDVDNSPVEQHGTITFTAEIPIDGTGGLFLTTEDDWFQQRS